MRSSGEFSFTISWKNSSEFFEININFIEKSYIIQKLNEKQFEAM